MTMSATISAPPPSCRIEEALSRDALAELSRRRGADVATTLFHEHISEWHADFIREIKDIDPAACLRVPGTLLVAPAAFWKEYPRYGGDGRLLRRVAESFGMSTRLAPVPSTASVTRAAGILASELDRFADGEVVLASLSKGGADVRVALDRWPALARKIRAWVQVAGLLRGSPVVTDLLESAWWRRGVARGFLAYTRADPQFLRELAWGRSPRLATPVDAPAGVTVISVVGFPLARHLRGNVAKRHARMARLGPNDGSTLVHDAIVDGGHVYPVWGADHYMRGPNVEPLLRRLLAYLARCT
jgi:hypothetical protein